MERHGIIGRRTFLAGLAASLAAGPALGQDHGWNKDSPFSQWVEGLQRPDAHSSCCGKGDFYSIVIDEDAIGNEGEAMGRARILDGRALRFPDGAIRTPIKNGLEFRFPKSKVNPPKDGNPGPTAYAFLGAEATHWDSDPDKITPSEKINFIWCVIPLPPGV